MPRLTLIACLSLLLASALPAQEPLQITVTGVSGLVQVRPEEDQPWQPATVGMTLGAGAEFRTGPRSAVRFTMPPDQTVTLDRLGTVKVLTAVAEAGGKVTTDLGMKYGRTRYDIHAGGVEHASTIHTPSVALAVRGTQVGVQQDFQAFAWSSENRAFFTGRDPRRPAIEFGAPTEVSDQTDGPAQENLARHTVDPNDPRSRHGDEHDLVREHPLGLLDYQANHFKGFRDIRPHQRDRTQNPDGPGQPPGQPPGDQQAGNGP